MINIHYSLIFGVILQHQLLMFNIQLIINTPEIYKCTWKPKIDVSCDIFRSSIRLYEKLWRLEADSIALYYTHLHLNVHEFMPVSAVSTSERRPQFMYQMSRDGMPFFKLCSGISEGHLKITYIVYNYYKLNN